jgi:hypothetical protein
MIDYGAKARAVVDDILEWREPDVFAAPGQFPTTEHAERANRDAGRYWWSEQAMRSFRTRDTEVIGGRVLVWSDSNFDHSARVYRAAPLSVDGSPELSDHEFVPSLEQARRLAKYLLRELADYDNVEA